MSLNSQKILGIRVTTSKKETILEEVEKWLSEKSGKPRIIVTPNPEQVMEAQSEKRFADILNRADVALPDGIGVALALGIPRIAGIEFMEDLVQLAAERGVTVGLIGGFNGLAVRALECLSRRWPGLRGWVWEPGEFSLSDLSNLGHLSDLSQKIRKTNTRMVFVGLGAPKQELFIERLCREMSFRPPSRNPAFEKKRWIPDHTFAMLSTRVRDDKRGVVFMSVGGAFDMISGTIQRAPVPIRKVGLEWLWRLCKQPWRWRRQLALVQFAFWALREKIVTR